MQPVPQPSAPTCWACHEPIGRGVATCVACGAAQPERWEYHIVVINEDWRHRRLLDSWRTPELNALGLQGWELVAMEHKTSLQHEIIERSLVFKRRLI